MPETRTAHTPYRAARGHPNHKKKRADLDDAGKVEGVTALVQGRGILFPRHRAHADRAIHLFLFLPRLAWGRLQRGGICFRLRRSTAARFIATAAESEEGYDECAQLLGH